MEHTVQCRTTLSTYICICVRVRIDSIEYTLFNKHDSLRAVAAAAHSAAKQEREQTAIKSAYFMPICCCSDFCVYTHITRDYVLNTCHVSLKLQRRENIYRNWSSNFHPRLISTSVRCVLCLAFLFLFLLLFFFLFFYNIVCLFVCCCCRHCCFCCYISLLFIRLLFLPFSMCAFCTPMPVCTCGERDCASMCAFIPQI